MVRRMKARKFLTLSAMILLSLSTLAQTTIACNAQGIERYTGFLGSPLSYIIEAPSETKINEAIDIKITMITEVKLYVEIIQVIIDGAGVLYKTNLAEKTNLDAKATLNKEINVSPNAEGTIKCHIKVSYRYKQRGIYHDEYCEIEMPICQVKEKLYQELQ